jgi:hypothetical protein
VGFPSDTFQKIRFLGVVPLEAMSIEGVHQVGVPILLLVALVWSNDIWVSLLSSLPSSLHWKQFSFQAL